ncbi:nucleoside 2-deoxyribosyltransferase [Candidatus Woesebacteria bacterium]|nr:nucleoside 2-deoxyribosyltransferase [Candidatus Woesebacteria bacterium]
MRIYFAGSMVDGQIYGEGMRAIVSELRKEGHRILTGFVIGEPLDEGYPENAWARDIPLLQECDAVVAEVSQPSFGAGIELGIAAVAFGKPVLCLRHQSLEKAKLSHLIMRGPYKLAYYDHEVEGSISSAVRKFTETINAEGKIERERG